jgi:AcrR family transcriptional regulator
MATTITRPYRGVSAEQRRADRRERLLEAGLDLLGGEGFGATTVRGVCARAGLTERYFYESFKDLEALLLAVFDEIIEDATRAVLEAVAQAPHDEREKSRAAIAAFVDLMTDDPRKGRVAFVEAMGSEALMLRRLATMRAFAQLIADQAQAFYGAPAAQREDAELTALLLVGGLAETLIAWLGGSLRLSRDRLVDHVANLFVAAANVRSTRSDAP